MQLYTKEGDVFAPAINIDVERIRRVLGLIDQPPPKEESPGPKELPGDSWEVTPGNTVQDAIDAAKEGQSILLRTGTYFGPVNLKTGVTLQAYPGENVTISGLVSLTEWTESGGLWEHSLSWLKGLKQHVAKGILNSRGIPNEEGELHRTKMRPELVTHGGIPMKQVYSVGAVEPGCYFVSGPADKPNTLHVRLAESQSIDRVRIAAYPTLLYSSDPACSRVKVKGIRFAYASNTGKQGLIETVGDSWELEEVVSDYANSVGIYARGLHHSLNGVTAQNAGQMGWLGKISDSIFESCSNMYPNWKGFDPRWEAGHKFSHSYDNVFNGWLGVGDPAMNALGLGGPLFWFDISNKRNKVKGMVLRNALKAALMIEHYAHENEFEGIQVDGVSKYKGSAGVGVQIQSNVTHCTLTDFEVRNCEGDAMRYKKEEGRGPSGFNQFRKFTFNGNARNWRVEGELNNMPDTFEDAGM